MTGVSQNVDGASSNGGNGRVVFPHGWTYEMTRGNRASVWTARVFDPDGSEWGDWPGALCGISGVTVIARTERQAVRRLRRKIKGFHRHWAWKRDRSV